MAKTEQAVIQTIDQLSGFFKGDREVEKFEKANDQYIRLIREGVVKSRGNNLLSADEFHLHKVQFNIQRSI